MDRGEIRLFALDASRAFGDKVSGALGVPLSAHEERGFEDGEHKARSLVNVRGADVYVVHSLYGDPGQSVNDKLCRLLFFIGALQDASAARVTAIVPYLAYARKDRKTQARDPVTTRYVAALFEAVGTDRLVTLDVHNLAAFQNAFRCHTDHLEARRLFVDHFAAVLGDQEIAVASPDIGGVKRAEEFRRSLEGAVGRSVAGAFMEKRRSGGVVSGEAIVGEVRDRAVVILDDLISTGTTIARAAAACRRLGARTVYAAASHGVFVGEAQRVLSESGLQRIVVTDTIPPLRLSAEFVREKLVILDAATLCAEAIRHIHVGGSVAELLDV